MTGETNSPPWTIENASSKIASKALRGRGGWTRYSTVNLSCYKQKSPTKRQGFLKKDLDNLEPKSYRHQEVSGCLWVVEVLGCLRATGNVAKSITVGSI